MLLLLFLAPYSFICCYVYHVHIIIQGCDTFTISPAVADELLTDPLTEAAAEAFEQAVEEIGGNTW